MIDRLRMRLLRLRIRMLAEPALASFEHRRLGSCEGWPEWEICDRALDSRSLLRIDRQLAAYEHRYGSDEFLCTHLLYAAARMQGGFCHRWELVGDAHRLDAHHVLAQADVLRSPGETSLVPATKLVRLWWSDLSDMWNVEQLITGGPRVFDQDLPEYGFARRA